MALQQQRKSTPEELEEYHRKLRRTALVVLDFRDVSQLLKLPDDVFIQDVFFDARVNGLMIRLRSDRFEEVPACAEAPILSKSQKIFEKCEHGAVHVTIDFGSGIPTAENGKS